jgi:GNAT superfamily N-acetyltransferase
VAEGQLNELGNAPANYKPNRKRSRSLFHATVDNHWVDVFFDRSEFNDTLHITFAVNGNYDTPSQPTGASRSTVKILSTVLNIVKQKLPEYIAKARPPGISFTAKGDNRASLYRKYFVPVIQNILGPKWQHEEYPNMGMIVFHWRPVKKQGVAEDVENFNGIGISMEVQGDEIMVRATAGGRELGHVLFVEEGEYLMPQDLEVDERFQGQGIAAAMYDYVKSKGYRIRRSGQQTDAGAGFWGKHRPEQNVWENFIDGKHPEDKGDSKRLGVPTKASVSTLRKVAKQGGRKGQLAHWMANMKAGRAKAKKE